MFIPISSLLTPQTPGQEVAAPLHNDGARRAPAAGHVLVPFRQDDAAGELGTALEIVSSLRPGARVTLLRVLPHLPEAAARSFHWLDAVERLHRAQERAHHGVLEKARATIAARIAHEIPARLHRALALHAECRAGDPAAEIARFANEQGVDLVVLAGERVRWRWPLSRPLSDRLLRLTDKPVIFIHPPAKRPQAATP